MSEQPEPPKIIDAFTRKAFVHKDDGEPAKVEIDAGSLALVEEMLERVKSGQATHLCVIGLHNGDVMTAASQRPDDTFIQLALLNLGADSLKAMIGRQLEDYRRQPEDLDDEDE